MSAAEEKAVEAKPIQEKRFTSVRLQKETVGMLKERGHKGESYDDIIKRLLQKRRR